MKPLLMFFVSFSAGMLILVFYLVLQINNKLDKDHPIKYMRDYQIEVTQDSIFIMDNLRHVGTISYTDDSGLGKIVEDDNE